MRKKSLLISSLLFTLMAMTAFAQDPIQPGTYYLQNKGTGEFLTSGANYGTRGVLRPHGVDVVVAASGDGFIITTRLNSNTKRLNPDDGYMDGSGSASTSWNIVPLDDGTYGLYSNTKNYYYGYNPEYTYPFVVRLDKYTDTESDYTHWKFWTKDELAATLDNADAEHPVDASFLITAPDFLIGDQRVLSDKCWGPDVTAISGDKSSGSYTINSANVEAFEKTSYNATQTITGIPNGIYSLSVQGFYRYGSRSTGAPTHYLNGTEEHLYALYAGSKSIELPSVYSEAKESSTGGFTYTTDAGYVPNGQSDAAKCFSEGYYTTTLTDIVVTDNTLTLGVKRTEDKAVTGDWCCYDNFTLMYYGLDLSVLKEDALATIDEYEALNTIGDTEYATIISEQRTAVQNATSDTEIAAAVNVVKEAYVYLQSAGVPTTEALDLTSLLVNADLRDGTNGWTTTGSWGTKTDTDVAVAEHYSGWSSIDNATGTLKQQVALSPGKYRLTAHAFYRWGSAYNSDTNNDGVERSLFYMFAGNQQENVKRLASETLPELRPETYANTIEEAAAAFNAGLYVNKIIFDVDEKGVVEMGFSGNHDRDKCWFIAGPVKLEKISDEVIAAEAAAEIEAAKNEYQNLKTAFNNIATQSELVVFDTTTSDEAYAAATTVEEVETACYLLADKFGETLSETNLQFDFTELLTNPSFETGTKEGWDTYSIGDVTVKTLADCTVSNAEGNYVLNAWTTSSSAAINHFALQTVKYLPKGSYQLTGILSSSQTSSNLRLAANEETEKAVIVGSATGMKTLLPFVLEESQDVRLGVVSDRYFRCDAFHLYYGSVMFAKRESCLEQIAAYEAIAQQATDRTAYDAAVTEAEAQLEIATTPEEADQAMEGVTTAVKTLIQTVPATKGLYDITALMVNPDMAGDYGWTATTTPTTGSGISELYNVTDDFSILQTIEDMPAGNYTFAVQGFHRNGDYTSLRTQYVNRGVSSVAASVKLADKQQPILNIFDNTRYNVISNTGNYKPMPDGSAFPNGMDTASEVFSQGLYWNTISTTTEEAGDIQFGIEMTGGAAYNWLAYDNAHLFYGGNYELSADTLTTLAAPMLANITSTRTLKAGQPNAVILPYDANTDDFQNVYELGRVQEGNAILVKASNMKAGRPYFVMVEEDKMLQADNVMIANIVPDSIPALWDGTFQTGLFMPGEVEQGFILNEDGTAFIKATATTEPCTPVFYLPISYGDIETLGITAIDDLNDITFTPQIENYKAHEFLANNTYTTESESVIKTYNVMPPARRDMPNGVAIPIPAQAATPTSQKITISTAPDFSENAYTKNMPAGATVYRVFNFIPDVTYYYKVEADGNTITNGQFTPEGQLRMIFIDSGSNIRDLGGWTTEDGSKVKYGKIFRGAELHAGKQTTATSTDLLELRRLGLRAEIDLREDVDFADGLATQSALGTTAEYYYFNQSMWNSDALQAYQMQYRNCFNIIAKNLEQDKAVYFHCIWGADRTGAMAFLIEGLLGVQKGDMYKDYELTTFSKAGSRVKANLEDKFNYIDTFTGDTQQEKFYNYLHDYVGVPADTLNTILGIMLELPTVELDETQAYEPQNVLCANINLKRSINTGLNTIVLPFELSTDEVVEYFGEGTTIYTLGGERERTEGVFTLLFEQLDYIPANTPVIIDAQCEEWNEKTFPAKSLSADEFQTVETEHFSFVPVMEPTTVPEGAYFLKKGTSEIKKSLGSSPIKTFRAYIAVNEWADVKAINIELQEGKAVGISDINNDESNARLYDISGRRIKKADASRQIIITDGKKFIKK